MNVHFVFRAGYLVIISIYCLALFNVPVSAAELHLDQTIELKSLIDSMKVKVESVPDLIQSYDKYYYRGFEVDLPTQDACVKDSSVYDYLQKILREGINEAALRHFIEGVIAPRFHDERVDVVIKKEGEKVVFDGNGRNGRMVNTVSLARLMKKSIEGGVSTILLPFETDFAKVEVLDKELRDSGIIEIVSTGVSDFSRSPRNRIHNIQIGLNSFNGLIMEPNAIFSIGDALGAVNARTGYLPELVIKGSKTLPEYGGGLCQVSSTVYRAALFAGLPIVQRRNHSYAVSYYNPPGTDATIYPPSIDLKFQNDFEAPILIQTYTEGSLAYFTFYGSRDQRAVRMYGPYISNWVGAPPNKIEYTSSLAPGQKKKVGGAHPGFVARWYRFVNDNAGDVKISESIVSRYQARPLFYMVGKAEEVEGEGDEGGGSASEEG